MNKADLRLLLKLLAVPTAPFREQQVRAFATARLAAWGVPHGRDPHGNLLVGVRDEADYRRLLNSRSREPVRLFIAHMDHPGFHVERWLDARSLAIRWHGGSPVKHLAGAKVWLADAAGYVGTGALRKVVLHPPGYAMETALVRLPDRSLYNAGVRAEDLFGGLGFRAPVWQSGQRLYTKAADDLVGVFAILQTARALYRSQRQDAGWNETCYPDTLLL